MKKTLCNGLSLLFLGTLALLFVSCELGGTIEWPSCNIVYNSNYGSGETANSKHNYGSSFNLSANQFDRTGYTFLGWADSPTGTITYMDQEAMDKESVGTKTRITLYAQWMANAYTIAFDSNGGTGTMPDKDLQYDEEWALAQNTFINGDNLFLGWALSESGAVLYDDEELIKNLSAVDGDTVTLYARWSHQELFVSSTDDSTANDESTLGLVGTRAESSDTSIATAKIENGKINITSVSVGNAVITVFDSSNNEATIDVTVEETGNIIIGNIVKHIANSVSSLDALREKLAALPMTNANDPVKVNLVSINITNAWGEINDIVMTAQKHIILDLSNCTANQNAITGRSSPSGNDMNVIQYNEYMKGIILPSTLEAIGNNAFYNCYNLSSITIPAGVPFIGSNAFYNCTGLTSITFEESAVDINDAYFPESFVEAYEDEGAGTYNKSNGSELWIKEDGMIATLMNDLDALISTTAANPATIKLKAGNISNKWGHINTIIDNAEKHVILDLSDCTVEGNTVTGANSSWIAPSGNDMNVISNNYYIVGLILPSTLETIDDYAFQNCSYLASITIPESVSSIGDYAFQYCSGLLVVRLKSNDIEMGTESFPGNLSSTYDNEGEGTYTRTQGSDVWVIEGGILSILEEDLSALTTTSADNPKTIKLEAADISDIWSIIHTTIQSAKKYVILDLSDCTFEGNTITGNYFTPSGNDMNIMKANEYIKSIILPSTLDSIGTAAFYGCTYLTSVTIPSSVSSIGAGAFENCSGLTSLTIPANVESIGSQVFTGCTNLNSITFARADLNLSTAEFPGDLNMMYKAEGVGTYTRTAGSNNWAKKGGALDTLINDLAELTGTSAENPATVTLEAITFTNADAVPEGTIGWSRINDIVLSARKYVIINLSDCIAYGNTVTGRTSPYGNDINIIQNNQFVKGIIFPSTLETIGEYAFYNNSGTLTNITIPASVTSLGYYAFGGSYSSLTSVTFERGGIGLGGNNFPGNLSTVYTAEGEGTYIRTAGSDTWENVAIANLKKDIAALTSTSAESPATIKLTATNISNRWGNINNIVKTAGKYVVLDLSDCTTNGNTIIGNSQTSYLSTNDMNIIYSNEYIKSIILPSTLETIGESAFSGCSYLTSVIISDSVNAIGNYAFQGCSSLKSVVIPESVNSIGTWAFVTCSGLSSVTIDSNIMSLSSQAFPGNLDSVYSAGGAGTYKTIEQKYWVKSTPYTDALLEQLAALSGTSVGNPAQLKLEAVTFTTAEVLSEDIIHLNEINNTILAAGKYINLDLSDCTAEGNTMTSSAMSNSEYIKSIIFPSTLETIENNAFYGNGRIISITIPASVISIGGRAFSNCYTLTRVTFEGNNTVIGQAAFHSSINNGNISYQNVLNSAYATGGAGIYTRTAEQDNWTKTGGSTNSPLDALKAQLTALTNTSASNPATVKLAPITFTTDDSIPSGAVGWGEINTAVLNAQKYVVLDLSDCTAEGNEIGGSENPDGNDINVIKNNQYVKGMILPDTLITIADYTFQGCSYLTSIDIPDSVNEIGIYAFMNCALSSLSIPKGITSISQAAFEGNSFSSVIIPDYIDSIGEYAFYRNDNLVSVTFEKSGIDIDNYVFSLLGSYYDNTLKNIYSASTGGAGIYTRTAGQNNWVKTGGIISPLDALKAQLAALSGTSASSPATVKLAPLTFTTDDSVPSGAVGWGEINTAMLNAGKYVVLDLSDCTAEGNTVTGNFLVSGNDMDIVRENEYIKDIILPSTLKTIGSHAFYGCGNLSSKIITDLPVGVTSIGERAFGRMGYSFINITIPDSITSIGSLAFWECSELVSVTIPDSVTSIGANAFSGCLVLTSVTFEKSGLDISDVGFPGNNLSTVYTAGGAGTYTRTAGSDDWVKEFVEMAFVPGGSFEMGKDLGTAATGDVTPVHTVTLSSFYMGKYEVTQGQYLEVMGTNPSYFMSDPAADEVQAKRPVEQVTWYEAVAFCNALSEDEGLSPAYTISETTVTLNSGANGYRLPTEAEWEYAAKGGNGSPGSYTYAGSNNPDEVAWYSSNSGSKTHEVGTKAANGLGIYDMSGNVYEWCWDWYGTYSSSAQTNPLGASSGTDRMLRGGDWYFTASFLRSVRRNEDTPSLRGVSLGFRVVRPQA
jgi:uncharacterized repeat protein (TIGR02543 family)